MSTIEPAPLVVAGEHTESRSAPSPASDWCLRVDLASRATTLRGGTFVERRGLSGFLAGRLATPFTLERAMASWCDEGDTALSRLRGQFALALASPDGRDVSVVRDPLGSHPLYFSVTPRAVVIAPRVAALLNEPDVSRELNRAAIADHLCKRWPDRQETFFHSIRRLPPGWLLRVGPHGITSRRYWEPSREEITWLPDEEVDRFDDLLDQAVSRGMTGRAGVFLSGGFDSVSVAAVAADLARRTSTSAPRALSLGFPDPSCDEQYVQRSVARDLGMPIELVPFAEAAGTRGLLREALDLNSGLSAPLFNTWMPAYLHLVRRARLAGVDTILTGEGGDEWLGASPFLTADLLLRGDIAGVVRMARTWKRSYRQDWFTVVRGTLWRYGLRPIAGMACHQLAPHRWDAYRARKVIRATPDWISKDSTLRQAQLERARSSVPAANPVGGFYSRESRASLDHTLQSWLFDEQFELGQRHGVRYVHPYWDPDLVAHVYRVRPERLNEHNRTKALVRRTLARRFPSLGFERQRKVPAMDFFAGILRREAPVLGEAVSDFKGLASLGILVPDAARAFMRRAWSDSPREIGRAWNLVNMEVWVRQHLL